MYFLHVIFDSKDGKDALSSDRGQEVKDGIEKSPFCASFRTYVGRDLDVMKRNDFSAELEDDEENDSRRRSTQGNK